MVRRSVPVATPSWDDLVAMLRDRGIEHVGVAPASVLERARTALHTRKSEGLAAGMGFTYRNPDRSTDPQHAVPGAKSIIVAARPYRLDDEPTKPPPTDGPFASVGRYAWVDHYAPLRAALRDVARYVRRSGARAVAFADDNSLVDREVAYLGGIGWFGKNANILVPGAGSFFVLGSIVTTLDLPLSTPIRDGCGPCRQCLDGCPTGAIVAPGVVDGNKCLAWLAQKPGPFPVEFRAALGDRLYGCDDCQTVCPPSVRLGNKHRISAPSGAEVQAWVDVCELLESTDEELIERHGRWYLADRDPTWWRRNALIVLGNTGDGSHRRVAALIDLYRQHPHEILREHAEWAAHQLGLDSPAA